jgi:hypothetical protein
MLNAGLVGFLALLFAGIPASAQLRSPIAFERSQSLAVGAENYSLVKSVRQLAATRQRPREETIAWWELRDPRSNTIYRREYPVKLDKAGFETQTEVQAVGIATKLGRGVLVQGMELPSSPKGGGWLQFFGEQWDQSGSGVVPFGPPVSIEGDFIDVAIDPRRPIAPTGPGSNLVVMNDVLRFRLWTGNFSIIYPVLINWITGRLEPAWRCSRSTIRQYIDRCSYPVKVEAHRQRELSFVRLFDEPDEALTPRHVVIKPESDVDYLEAETPVAWDESADWIAFRVPDSSAVWLKVRIDGHEGWIHTGEDFQAVGLPQAG